MITALVEIDVEKGLVGETAQALADLDGVDQVWSVTGDHDLVALLRLREYDRLAELVTGTIDPMPSIRKTRTMLAFKVYSRRQLEEGWAAGAE